MMLVACKYNILTLSTISDAQIYTPILTQFDIKRSLSSVASNSIFLMTGRDAIKEMLTFFYFLKKSASNLLD